MLTKRKEVKRDGDEDCVLGKHYLDSQDDVITLALRMMSSAM